MILDALPHRPIVSGLLLLSLLVAISACDDGDDVAGDGDVFRHVAFENVEESARLDFREPATFVFREPSVWQQFWADHGTGSVPPIDFDSRMVVAIFWGEVTSCVTRVEAIRSVTQIGETVRVDVGPLPLPQICPAQTHPFQVIEFERVDFPVIFEGLVPGQ